MRTTPPWQPARGDRRLAGPLSVRTLGAGPPLVVLHGLVGSGNFWGGAYDVLADDHRLVVPDLLGFGRSDRPESGYGPDGHAEALAAALDSLDVCDPALVVAHSLGTVVALRFALRHPERVAGVLAFGPPLYGDAADAQRHVAASGPMGRLFVLPGPVAERTCSWMCEHRRAAARLARWSHPSLPPALAGDAVEHTWHSYSETLERCLLTGDPASWLDSIDAPIRLIAGDRDAVVNRDFLLELGRRHPQVDTEIWEGDHRLPLTHAAQCIAAIRSS